MSVRYMYGIWCRNQDGTIDVFWLQRRSQRVKDHAGLLDISFAGHIDADETPLQTAKREAKEEVGYDIDVAKLVYIFGYRNFSNGTKWEYLYQVEPDVAFIFDDGEVSEMKRIPLEKFITMARAPELNELMPASARVLQFVDKGPYSITVKITSISVQARNPDRVNVSIDGKYRLSLDVWQVTELGLRNGAEVTEEELAKWEEESAFGKLYARALEYTMIRPHSAKEVRDYLWRKTLTRKQRVTSHESRVAKDAANNKKSSGGDNANRTSYLVPRTSVVVIEKPGVSQGIADRVYDRLCAKGTLTTRVRAVLAGESQSSQRRQPAQSSSRS